MTKRIFTFLVAFLATLSGAVWGQSATTIDISNIVSNTSFSSGSETLGYIAKHGNYDTEGNTLKITKDGSYKIKGNASQSGTNSNVQISVAEGITVTIELDNLRTDASLGNVLHTNTDEAEELVKADRCALEIGEGATVTLTWNNACKLTSGGDRAGINVKEDATLIMKGSNTYELEVGSWNNASNGAITYGAGIGGDKTGASFGTIIIESGDIRAYSYAQGSGGKAYGAGIGGGYSDDTPKTSTSGTIIIKGGSIEATSAAIDKATSGEDYGAGIGGGNNGTCTNITITGGTITATTTNNKGDKIGNGHNYTATTSPSVIVAPAEPDGTVPSVTVPSDLTNTLVVSNGSTTIEGEVSLPEGTDHIYAPNITGSGTLKAYKITYNETKIEEGEGTHTITGLDAASNAVKDMYYNAGVTVEVPSNISCTLHHFVGWYKSGTPPSIVETTGEGTSAIATFTLPIAAPTDKQEAFTIQPVWVDKEQPIMAEADHGWTDSGTDNPDIDTAPSEAIGLLTYTLVAGTDAGNRLNDVEMSGNKFTGTPKLETEDNGYKELPDVTVTVKVKNSQSSKSYTVETPMVIHNGEIRITGVSVTDIDHEYNGQSHNGWNKDLGASDAYHLLTLTFTVNGETPATGQKLREGVHYIISGYTKDGNTETAQNDESLEIKEAGTYSDIKLKAIRESVKFAINSAPESDTYESNLSVTVDARDLTLVATDNNPITYKTNDTEPDFSTNASTYVKAGNTIGQDAVTINSGITATVDGAANAWKTQPGKYTVTFTAGNNATVNNTNYELPEGTSVTRDLIVKGEVTDPTVKPGEDSEWTLDTDGNFTRQYNGQVPSEGSIGSLVVTLGNNTEVTLEEGEGFEVTYTNAKKDVSEYEVTITFEESTYITSGFKEITLKITKKPMTVNFNFPSVITDAENINWSKADITYSGIVDNEEPTVSDCYLEIVDGTAWLRNFSLKDNATTEFLMNNYTISYQGNTGDITTNVNNGTDTDGDGNKDVELPDDEVTVDPDYDGGDGNIDRIDYYNIYEDEVCEGVTLEFSRDVVREGQSVVVTVKVDEEFDVTNLTLEYKESIFGYWKDLTLTPTENPGEYIIKNIYTDIYVRAEGAVPTGIESIDGAKVYTKDGSLFVQTPQQEQVRIISITGAIVKNEQQVGLKQYTGLQRGVYVVMVGDQVFKVRI